VMPLCDVPMRVRAAGPMRLAISGSSSSEGMDHRDWGLWWGLLEELDRLEALEAVAR
jgi:hypothetical protein